MLWRGGVAAQGCRSRVLPLARPFSSSLRTFVVPHAFRTQATTASSLSFGYSSTVAGRALSSSSFSTSSASSERTEDKSVKRIEVYAASWCPYCSRAKQLLDSKGVPYHEIDVDQVKGAKEEMTKRTGGKRTVPQVFADGEYVGDCSGLLALDAEGRLDGLLFSSSSAKKESGAS
ncbi:Glutaredoxin [Balamuthia mandrillaris]